MTGLEPFKKQVYDYSGLVLDGNLAEQRLHKCLQQAQQLLGLNATQYLARLQQSQTELDALVSQLTVNETYFFRESEQIALLAHSLLPRLQAQAGERPLRILSAGCSSGEEPYSLAMAILEAHGEQGLQQVTIDAGDVDLNILDKARQALYSSFSFRGVSDGLRQKYFTETARGFQLDPHISKAVRFFMLNLMADEYPAEQGLYDVIFFRNVSIYFDLETRQNIQRRFARIMQPDAVLFLGTTETLGNDFDIFDLHEEQGLYYFAKGQHLRPHKPPLPDPQPIAASQPARPAAPRMPEPATQPAPPRTQPDLQQLKQLLLEERHTEAQSKLDLVLHAEPELAAARLMQAWLDINARQFGQAATRLDRLLGEDSWNLDALLARGLCSKWQGDLDAACRHFKTACYAHAESWLAQYFYGEALRQHNQPQAARAPLQIARRILSSNLQADSCCQWLPLAPPAGDALFLIERQLLALKAMPGNGTRGDS
ncbi:MAG: hypothetical protein GX665_04035 [Gammaproteobacteria bacterium]|nr:hypothetical protein [Gammaproteobacteria bacterium]